MKINPFGFNRLTGYNKQVSQSKSTDKSIRPEDTVEISNSAKNQHLVSSFASERQDKVQQLKKQIEQGAYQVDYSAIAKSMLEYYKK